MKKIILAILTFTSLAVSAQTIRSPGGNLALIFTINSAGIPSYRLSYGDRFIVKESALGIELSEQTSFVRNFTIIKIDSSLVDESWNTVWGEVKSIRNNYRELSVTLGQTDAVNRIIVLRFRLFDDGLGFRYEFPQQENLNYFTVKDELTQFNLAADHIAFWIPGDYDSNEYYYTKTRLSGIDAAIGRNMNEISVKSLIDKNYIQSPLMLKSDDGIYINIFEAAQINYPAMHLKVDQSEFILTSQLVPDAAGNKAYLQTPCSTPWRTIIVSKNAADILSSKLILNLNEPSKIEDVSWIKPMKYVGIWWEMHVNKSSWNYADLNNVNLSSTNWNALKPNGRHGATTENTKRYIDFASKHGFDGVLVEGWNVGWEDWFGKWKENVFDFVTPYPDFNIAELSEYAAEKNVNLIMHHETSASVTNYERRMDEAYALMKKFGYPAVKTGYVGKIIPRGEHHDGQWMTDHYIRTAEKLAENRMMLNAHEPVRPTGLSRTYPNWLACEAARGNEFNAWSVGNPPEHETILPFTRLMG
ncbi:MAG: glycoside hydrolase family 97 catalytic domain-containing protein, partial [Melioribacteraceae bacterium]